MAQLEKEIKTRLDGNEIMISRLRGQIPSLLAIRGGMLVIDPEKREAALEIERKEAELRAANERMKGANAKIAEITKKELDAPYTLSSMLANLKSYETEKTGLENDLIRIERAIKGKESMGFSPGFNTIDRNGVFHAAPDPVGDAKKRKQAAERRIRELKKGIEKLNKVIAKVEPILQDSMRQ